MATVAAEKRNKKSHDGMTIAHQETGRNKRKVALDGFFARFSKRQKKREDIEVEEDDNDQKAKRRQAAKGLFEEFSSPLVRKEDKYGLYDGLDTAMEKYNDGVKSSIQDLLDPVADELDARAKGFDKHGRRIDRPDLPTPAMLDALEKQCRAIERPFAEDELELESTRSNSTKVTERYNMKRVITAYKDLYTRKRAEIESLELEISTLDTELEQAYKDVSNENLPALKRAQEQWESDQVKFKKASQAAKDLLAEEFNQAKAEEKAAAVEMNRKISAFMKEL